VAALALFNHVVTPEEQQRRLALHLTRAETALRGMQIEEIEGRVSELERASKASNARKRRSSGLGSTRTCSFGWRNHQGAEHLLGGLSKLEERGSQTEPSGSLKAGCFAGGAFFERLGEPRITSRACRMILHGPGRGLTSANRVQLPKVAARRRGITMHDYYSHFTTLASAGSLV